MREQPPLETINPSQNSVNNLLEPQLTGLCENPNRTTNLRNWVNTPFEQQIYGIEWTTPVRATHLYHVNAKEGWSIIMYFKRFKSVTRGYNHVWLIPLRHINSWGRRVVKITKKLTCTKWTYGHNYKVDTLSILLLTITGIILLNLESRNNSVMDRKLCY